MRSARNKLVVLAVVMLLAFGAATVNMSLGLFSDSESLGAGEIEAGSMTATSTVAGGSQQAASANGTVTTSDTSTAVTTSDEPTTAQTTETTTTTTITTTDG
ncbi:hypothetical protein [Haladaptatus sp. NG-SE-30]